MFERAAATAFESDKEGLQRELEALSESLTCSAQAVESLISGASSENGVRLRKYSEQLRSMAFEVPAIQRIAWAISFLDKELSRPTNLLRLAHIVRPTVFRRSQLSDQLTIGPVSKKERKEKGLSQGELVFKPPEGSARPVKI
jgi:hypothetical protein